MSLFDRYGIKEVADVTFYELLDGEIGKPVLYLDTLKVSTVEQAAENTEVRGGKGNAALMAWDYGKEVTVNLEDALFSTKSLEVMYGNKSVVGKKSITRTKTVFVKDSVPMFKKGTEGWRFNAENASKLGLKWDWEGEDVVLDETLVLVGTSGDVGRVETTEGGEPGLYVYPGTATGVSKIPSYVDKDQIIVTAENGAFVTIKEEDGFWAFSCRGETIEPNSQFEVSVTYNCNYSAVGSLAFEEIGKEITGDASIMIGGEKVAITNKNSTDFPIQAFVNQGLAKEDDTEIYLSGLYLFQIITDEDSTESRTVEISANSFPGTYYVTAETYVRNEVTSKDEFFFIEFPKVKVMSENNAITLEADGDPAVFNLTLKALKSGNKPLMRVIQYESIN